MTRKTSLLYTLTIFLLFSVFCLETTVESKKTLANISHKFGLSMPGFEDFVIEKDILKNSGTKNFRAILAKNNETLIKIKSISNIAKDEADLYVKERLFVINSLYKRIPSPYPGMVSNTIECPDELKPHKEDVVIEGKNTCVRVLSSTPRFTYGASSEDLVKYRAVLLFIYREGSATLYRIEMFIPKGVFQKKKTLELLKSIEFVQQEGLENKQKIALSNSNWQHTERTRTKLATKNKWEYLKNANLIIIGIEPLGANHMPAYGYSRETTPNIDRFFNDAFLFKTAVSASSWTLPAFISWFTSLYPSQHKIVNKYSFFDKKKKVLSNLENICPKVISLAQVLKTHGYSTAAFTGGAALSSHFGYHLGFDQYYDQIDFGGGDVVLPLALKWLRENRNHKFFIFLQGFDVHGRFQLSKTKKGKFSDPKYNGKYEGTVKEYWDLRNASLSNDFPNMSKNDLQFWRANYDEKIYEADERLGLFFKEIQKLQLKEKTIVVLSSGSGNEFCEHGRFDHGFSLYEELIRVPLLIYVPGKKRKEILDQVQTIDIMPTVLELLNILPSKTLQLQMQGVSLSPLMFGAEITSDAFSETDYLLCAFKRSIRTNNGWKFIYSLDTEEKELYHLNDDPHEKINLIEKEKQVAYELEQRLFEHLQSMKKWVCGFQKIAPK